MFEGSPGVIHSCCPYRKRGHLKLFLSFSSGVKFLLEKKPAPQIKVKMNRSHNSNFQEHISTEPKTNKTRSIGHPLVMANRSSFQLDALSGSTDLLVPNLFRTVAPFELLQTLRGLQ